jgi:hypothetical protein
MVRPFFADPQSLVSLQQCPPALSTRPLKPKEIRQLAHVIHAPETLRLPLRVCSCKCQSCTSSCSSEILTNKVREPKCAVLERLLCVLRQHALHLIRLSTLKYPLRLVIASDNGA